MDALEPAHLDKICDACGYLRRGLPDGSLCPECGSAPPEIVDVGVGQRIDVRGALERLVITRGRLVWLRTLAVGLALLLYASYCAIRVTLVMGVGSMALPAVNMPGPKISIMAMLQRSLDGRPGEWGVAGTMAALATVVAVWLITIRPMRIDDEDGPFSLATLTRWLTVLIVGAVMGMLLSGSIPIDNPRWGTVKWYWLAILAGELPINTLLYFHLYRTAVELGDRRAIRCFRTALWLVPGLIAGAVVIATFLVFAKSPVGSEKDFPPLSRLLMGAYGAAALTAGVITTAGIGSLLATVCGEAFGVWALAARRAIRSLPGSIRTVAGHVQREPARWIVVAGLALWLWQLPITIEEYLTFIPDRFSVNGSFPILNYAGPRLQVFSVANGLAVTGGSSLSRLSACAATLLAFWMVTTPGMFPRARMAEYGRLAARWTPIVVLGASMGLAMNFRLQDLDHRSQPSLIVAVIITFIEAPITTLMYFHLSRIAGQWVSKSLARRLRILALAAGGISLVPLIAFTFSETIRTNRYSTSVAWLCTGYGALSAIIACLSILSLIQLAWGIATADRSAAHCPEPDEVTTPTSQPSPPPPPSHPATAHSISS